MKVLIVNIPNGIKFAVLTDPMKCIEILPENVYETVKKTKELTDEDMINFESYLENFLIPGQISIIEIED